MRRADPQSPEEPASRRSFVTLPLAQLVPNLTRPAFKRRSPAGATLMAEWLTIMGSHFAALTEPRRLSRGQLTIACAGPVAMELQHLQSVLIDRINVHAGSKLVERLRFTQDVLAGPAYIVAAIATTPEPDIKLEPMDAMLTPQLADALSMLLQAIRAGA